MVLFLVSLLWAAMAAREFGLLGGLLAPAFWVFLITVGGVWWIRRKPKLRVLVAALLPIALAFGVTASQSTMNPILKSTAQGFQSQELKLESTGPLAFGHLPVKIVSPRKLSGRGSLLFTGAQPHCTELLVKGNFLVSPPTDKVTAQNQFSLRSNGKINVECQTSVWSWLESAGAKARSQTLVALAGISIDSKALVLGLTDGDTRLLSQALNQRLKLLSLTHLNAVSGSNCAIVVAAIFALLSLLGLGRRLRVAGALVGLAAYLVLVGAQPSVIRAAGMSCIALASMAWGHRARALNVLAVAVLVLLVCWPDLAVSYGFALSAMATWGVIQLAPAIQPRLDAILPNWLALLVSISLAAQLACLPILVLLQSRFSVYSTLANVLVEPVVPVITVLGVAGALLAQISAWLAAPLFWMASVPAQYLVAVTNLLSAQPQGVSWPTGPLGVLLAAVLLAAVSTFGLAKGKIRWLSLAVAVSVLIGFSAVFVNNLVRSAGFAKGDWFYVSCDVGQGDATVIRSHGQVAVIDAGRDPGPVDLCLDRLGVNRVNLLVLTHFDLDHVGGVAGVIDHRRVDRAFFTSFNDDRPGAWATEQTVQNAGIPITHVSKGLSGTLGDFQWLVLSPHADGADAVDSNDGSVTMFFHSNAVNIITLADLPETGQQRLAQERSEWWQDSFRNQPLVMKVSHHGSADQFPEFIEWLRPQVATISVGLGNSYGHPTQRTLNVLHQAGSLILRTDLQGSLSLRLDSGRLVWGAAGSG